MKKGLTLQYLPHEHEVLKKRLSDLEEFALVVVNNSGGSSYAEIPTREDLFDWLTTMYQRQLDAFFTEIEELESQRDALLNRVKHDTRLREAEE